MTDGPWQSTHASPPRGGSGGRGRRIRLPLRFHGQPRLSGLRITPMRGKRVVGEPFDIEWVDVEFRPEGSVWIYDKGGKRLRWNRRAVSLMRQSGEGTTPTRLQQRQILQRWQAGTLKCTFDHRAVSKTVIGEYSARALALVVLCLMLAWPSKFRMPVRIPPSSPVEWAFGLLLLALTLGVVIYVGGCLRGILRERRGDVPNSIHIDSESISVDLRDGQSMRWAWNDVQGVTHRGACSRVTSVHGESWRVYAIGFRELTYWRLALLSAPAELVGRRDGSPVFAAIQMPLRMAAIHAGAAGVVFWFGTSGILPGRFLALELLLLGTAALILLSIPIVLARARRRESTSATQRRQAAARRHKIRERLAKTAHPSPVASPTTPASRSSVL